MATAEFIDLPTFRYWAGRPYNRLIYRQPPALTVGVAPKQIQASAEQLRNPRFRQAQKVMLATGITDEVGQEIDEGDILKIFTSRYESSAQAKTIAQPYYVEHRPGQGFVVVGANEHSALLKQGCPYKVSGNFFDSPHRIQEFPALLRIKKWSR